MLIDCRSLDTQAVPLPPGTAVVVLDTSTRRGLVDSEYNQRRAQCEAAARFFHVPALRDVAIERFEQECRRAWTRSPGGARGTSITENDRTLHAAEAMRRGDAGELGRLMNLSHQSLRDDYEVSSEALNAMVEARTEPSGLLRRPNDRRRLRRLRRGAGSSGGRRRLRA